jgi:hypothetical protein
MHLPVESEVLFSHTLLISPWRSRCGNCYTDLNEFGETCLNCGTRLYFMAADYQNIGESLDEMAQRFGKRFPYTFIGIVSVSAPIRLNTRWPAQ